MERYFLFMIEKNYILLVLDFRKFIKHFWIVWAIVLHCQCSQSVGIHALGLRERDLSCLVVLAISYHT